MPGGQGITCTGIRCFSATGRNSRRAKERRKASREKVEVGPILSLEPFIINVSGDPLKFVKISVAVELKNEKAAERTKKMTPVIRDIMLSVLGTKKPEVFMDVRRPRRHEKRAV